MLLLNTVQFLPMVEISGCQRVGQLALGVELIFETDATDDQALAAQYKADLVIASDGLNSRIRQRYAEVYQPDIDLRECRFVWLGTHQTFDAFTFAFEQTEHGWFQAHAYQFDDKTSTDRKSVV